MSKFTKVLHKRARRREYFRKFFRDFMKDVAKENSHEVIELALIVASGYLTKKEGEMVLILAREGMRYKHEKDKADNRKDAERSREVKSPSG